EVGHLRDEIVIMQQNRAIGPDGQRVFVTGHGNPGVGSRRLAFLSGHRSPPNIGSRSMMNWRSIARAGGRRPSIRDQATAWSGRPRSAGIVELSPAAAYP